MTKTPTLRSILRLFIIPVFATCLALAPWPALAQVNGAQGVSEKFTREELAQMLAPIALYPDALLSQILMASTYPIEVIEADRWLTRNPGLKGDTLDGALLDKGWDPSVKAICHFPSILALMSERIAETTNLGNAFLAQEAEVMDMIQELRARAHAQGNLSTSSQQTVVVERDSIIIEPANPRVIYVPYYDPYYIYGPWWYPAYPPYYWGPPGVTVGIGISYWPGFYFDFVFGNWCHFDWHLHYIYIDVHKRPRYVHHDRWTGKSGRWDHSPNHRRGVAYRDKHTARKYGQAPQRPADIGRDARGFPERRDVRRDTDRPFVDQTRFDRDKRTEDRARVDRAPLGRERVDREQQNRERAESDRQQPTKLDRDRQGQQRVERDRQTRQPTDQARRSRERAESEQQQRSRDNIFNQVEEGRKERMSSERGRYSRQDRSGDSRDRGRSGSDSSRGRDDRGRNRR